jgi:hypothetical protein
MLKSFGAATVGHDVLIALSNIGIVAGGISRGRLNVAMAWLFIAGDAVARVSADQT